MQEHEASDPAEEPIIRDVERFGWHCVAVVDDSPSPFVYSIGLIKTLGHAELIMFGLDTNMMHSCLNNVVKDIRDGRSFEEEGLYEGILDRFAVCVRPVERTWHSRYLGYAMWYCRTHASNLRAIQIVWPDRHGIFPGEVGCENPIVKLQPALHLPKQLS